MIPKRRYDKRNDGTEAPTSYLFFDTESHCNACGPDGNGTDFTLRLWSACYVRREAGTFRDPVWHRGRTAAEFWALVESYSDWKRPLWAFAHNAGFDLTQLSFWDELENLRWTAGPVRYWGKAKGKRKLKTWRGRMCLESRPFFLTVRGRRGMLKVVDTVNYWQRSLAKIGTRLGLPKGHVHFNSVDDETLQTYCDRDTDIVRVAVCGLVGWWLKEDCGTFQQTGPMLARTEWRHTCEVTAKGGATTALVLEHDSPARADEREASYGGWVEPFYTGTHAGPLWYVDCNSLYPFVMRDGLFPRARVRSVEGCNLSELRGWVEAYGAVALVMLDTGRSDATYPLIANGVQVHARGNFTTWLAGAELVRACRLGHVVNVFRVHLYSVAPLFAGWARKWLARRHRARMDGDVAHEEFCQLILHALPGKFAQKGEVWKDAEGGPVRRGWGQTCDLDATRNRLVRWRWVAGHTQRKVPGDEPLSAFPAIWGFITSQAREYMKAVIAALPVNSCLYIATDGLIVTDAGFKALRRLGYLHATEPGKFKADGPFAEAEIHGPNWYRLDGNWVIGGLWGKAERGPDGHYYADVWQHASSQLNSNPGGHCYKTRVRLQSLTATVKNDAAGDGWRRPFRYTAVDGMCDPRPRRGTFTHPE